MPSAAVHARHACISAAVRHSTNTPSDRTPQFAVEAKSPAFTTCADAHTARTTANIVSMRMVAPSLSGYYVFIERAAKFQLFPEASKPIEPLHKGHQVTVRWTLGNDALSIESVAIIETLHGLLREGQASH
jgi:hypothetical protein